jgi:hypothetical protein
METTSLNGIVKKINARVLGVQTQNVDFVRWISLLFDIQQTTMVY